VQQLEGKISGELLLLQERVASMEEELLTYRDLEALRSTAEDKKRVRRSGEGGEEEEEEGGRKWRLHVLQK